MITEKQHDQPVTAESRQPVMTRDQLQSFLSDRFPQVRDQITVEHVDAMAVTVRMHTQQQHLRPGGTVSGPAMFMLADVSVYLALLAMTGPAELAVTTSVSMDFMRKPAADADLLADCTLLKLGRALVVGDVRLRSEGAPVIAARASLTYSIPPERT